VKEIVKLIRKGILCNRIKVGEMGRNGETFSASHVGVKALVVF
jgi:hypothetical protein